jgi:hypothetical protein
VAGSDLPAILILPNTLPELQHESLFLFCMIEAGNVEKEYVVVEKMVVRSTHRTIILWNSPMAQRAPNATTIDQQNQASRP